MRLLVVTSRYPTPDRPAAGAFVRDRLADPRVTALVIAPRAYSGMKWIRFARLTFDALTARGTFDGVETHFVLPAGPIGVLAARRRGLPLVVYAHGSDVRSSIRHGGVRRRLARWVIRSASAVVANSADTAAHVRLLGGEATIVPPGVDLTRFSVLPRPPKRTVLYLGGNSADKGVDVARQLADTLVGPGIREVDVTEVPALMAVHDVVLVPSIAEGFGLVAAEAAAAGRWVIASSVGGLKDIVVEGVSGSLVVDGDFAAALSNVPDYQPAEVARQAVRFSLDRHWAGMATIWNQVLAARPGKVG